MGRASLAFPKQLSIAVIEATDRFDRVAQLARELRGARGQHAGAASLVT
jgi:hypothetical protein